MEEEIDRSKDLCIICRNVIPKDLILWKALKMDKFRAVQSATLRCFNLSQDPYIGQTTVNMISMRPSGRQKGIYCGKCRKVNQELFHLLQDLAAVERKINLVMSSVKSEFRKTFFSTDDLQAYVESSKGLAREFNSTRLQMAECSDMEVMKIYNRLPHEFGESEASKFIIRGRVRHQPAPKAGPMCSKNIKKPLYLLPMQKPEMPSLYGNLDPIRNVHFGPKVTKDQQEARIHKIPGLSVYEPVAEPFETGTTHGDEDWKTLIPEINFGDFDDDGDPMETNHHAESPEPQKTAKVQHPVYTPKEDWLLGKFGIRECKVVIKRLDERVIAALGVRDHNFPCLFDDCDARKDFTLFDRNRHLEEVHGMAETDIVALDVAKRGNIFEEGVAKVLYCSAKDCTGYGPFTSTKELNQHTVMYHKPEEVPPDVFEESSTNRFSLRPKRRKTFVQLEESEDDDEDEVVEIAQEDGSQQQNPDDESRPTEMEDSDWELPEPEPKPMKIYSRCIFNECYDHRIFKSLRSLLDHIHNVHQLPLTAEELPDLLAANDGLVYDDEVQQVPPVSKTYQCYFADCPIETEFASEAELDQHVQEAHADAEAIRVAKARIEKRNYGCPVFGCVERYEEIQGRRDHIRFAHNGLKNYAKCEFCNKRIPSSELLEIHQKEKHREKFFTCHICGAKFHHMSKCEAHVKKHDLPKEPKPKYPYKREQHTCDRCGNVYCKRQALTRHMIKAHEGRKDYSCDQCGDQFYFATNLRDHIKVAHVGTRDFICGICGNAFVLKKHLVNHQRRHKKAAAPGAGPSLDETGESAKIEVDESTTVEDIEPPQTSSGPRGGPRKPAEKETSVEDVKPPKTGSRRRVGRPRKSAENGHKREVEETVTRDFSLEVEAAIEELTSSSQVSQESTASSSHPVDLTDWTSFGGLQQQQQNYNHLSTPQPYVIPQTSTSRSPPRATRTPSHTFLPSTHQQQYVPQPAIFTNAAGFPRLQNLAQSSGNSHPQGGVPLNHSIGSQPAFIPQPPALFQQPNYNQQNTDRNAQLGYFGYLQ